MLFLGPRGLSDSAGRWRLGGGRTVGDNAPGTVREARADHVERTGPLPEREVAPGTCRLCRIVAPASRSRLASRGRVRVAVCGISRRAGPRHGGCRTYG